MRPSRPVPALGDAVLVHYLASSEPGQIVAVEGPRVLVETAQGREWFELSKVTGASCAPARRTRRGSAGPNRRRSDSAPRPTMDRPPGKSRME